VIDVNRALQISRIVHDLCDNVPHDIGMIIENAIHDSFNSDPMIGIRNLHIQLCYDYVKFAKKAIDDKIGEGFCDIPEVKEIRTVLDYLERKYPSLNKNTEEEQLSECCGSKLLGNETDQICSECREHV